MFSDGYDLFKSGDIPEDHRESPAKDKYGQELDEASREPHVFENLTDYLQGEETDEYGMDKEYSKGVLSDALQRFLEPSGSAANVRRCTINGKHHKDRKNTAAIERRIENGSIYPG